MHRLNVAPMMGCTDRHCRFLFRLLSPNANLYSEMIVADALLHGNRDRLLQHNESGPTAIQLGGSDPAKLATAAKFVEAAGYSEVNLNCGCPSDRVQQGGIGACLMAQPKLVADCFERMADAVSIPITIKTRIGIDDQDSFEFFQEFISTLFGAGCREFHIHARKAYLSGLSPKENREIPPLNYDFVSRIQTEFPEADFVLNGGISTLKDSINLLQEHRGVMLGRAPYSNPYLLAELDNAIYLSEKVSRDAVIMQYEQYMMTQIKDGTHLKHMAKHLLGLYTGMPGARAFRRHLSTHMYAESADVDVVNQAIELVDTNHWSHSA